MRTPRLPLRRTAEEAASFNHPLSAQEPAQKFNEEGDGLLPTFTVWGVQFLTFPFVVFLALLASVVTFLTAKKYNAAYRIAVFQMGLPILVFAAVGARLLSAITRMLTSDQAFLRNLLDGGAVFYGGLIGGAVGLLLVCAAKHCEFLAFSDVFVTLLPIAHAIGRLGCYLNGCCYGRAYNGVFAVDYVVNGVCTTVFPTWFFEAGFCLLLFLYFQLLHKRNAIGNRTAIYLIAYATCRFLIEFMRGDEIRGHIGFLSSSQIIGLFMLLLGLGILHVSLKMNAVNKLFNKKGENDGVISISS